MKRKLKIIIISVLGMVAIAAIGLIITFSMRSRDLQTFKGIWVGEIILENTTYDQQLDIYSQGLSHGVKASSNYYGYHYLLVNWYRKGNELIYTMNDKANEAIFRLNTTDKDTLSGTRTQYGETVNITFKKISDDAVNGKYYKDNYEVPYKERKKQLEDFSDYGEDGVEIPFTYELNQREGYEELISEYNLDSVVEGYDDVERMKVLLRFVSDNFRHDGSAGMPKERDANSLIAYCKEKGAINCRGLAIILAELLRVYGIPAKHITCMPKEADFNECHVITHAYSEDLKQWIMLDPTYKLILQDKNNNYISIPKFREYLINGKGLKANDDAGWNGGVFYLDDYRRYMTKNTFRFSSATDFYYGAEGGYNGNIENMLMPLNYTEAFEERNTTSASVFWAIP